MDAATKTRLPDQTIVQMTRAALGEEITVQHIRPLSGGFCSAVYLVETSQCRLVLKVGTNANVKVMRHEVQYIPTEVKMLRLIGENTDIPMPRLIAFDDSCSIVHTPYFFYELAGWSAAQWLYGSDGRAAAQHSPAGGGRYKKNLRHSGAYIWNSLDFRKSVRLQQCVCLSAV